MIIPQTKLGYQKQTVVASPELSVSTKFNLKIEYCSIIGKLYHVCG